MKVKKIINYFRKKFGKIGTPYEVRRAVFERCWKERQKELCK